MAFQTIKRGDSILVYFFCYFVLEVEIFETKSPFNN